MNRRHALLATLPLLGLQAAARAASGSSATDAALTARLRTGRVALLLRHSITEAGVGDPPGLRLGDCTTQRNLSVEGRAQAQRIGQWFTANGLRPTQVRSSAWCRCLDTGTLAFGKAARWDALNSFFDDGASQAARTAVLEAALPSIGAGQFEVWITHQVNITALVGGFAQMGEGTLVEPAESSGTARVVGRWRADA